MWDSTRGFGFVRPDDAGQPDVFVHQSVIKSEGFRSLGIDEPVEFEVEKDDMGRVRASKVTGPGGADVKGQIRREPRVPKRVRESAPQEN